MGRAHKQQHLRPSEFQTSVGSMLAAYSPDPQRLSRSQRGVPRYSQCFPAKLTLHRLDTQPR